MEESKTLSPEAEACTHDCSTCGAACAGHEFAPHSCSCESDGERKPDVFERMDNLVNSLDDEEVLKAIRKITEELENMD